jgi:4-hydroxy-2-oxovalerate aldolase
MPRQMKQASASGLRGPERHKGLQSQTRPHKDIRIMDVTLRDGSYVINFQFTANDTSLIASALERAGFTLIEVGHGVGLRASDAGQGTAAATDAEYMAAAASAVKKASWGMFCIPGIAKLEDVDLLASFGAGFVRVGTNVDEADTAKPFIERAKRNGLFVSSNFMKSYALNPRQFAAKAKLAQQYGTDVLCVVDSAGGMLPEQLAGYFRAVQDECDVPLGFHGHNNLGLANSNSLLAVQMGAQIVDTALQGMGRSAGNASTELVVALLERAGLDLGHDLLEVLDISERYIQPLIQKRGLYPIDVVAGYAQFHSSFMGTISRAASQHQVDPRLLIIELCKVTQTTAPQDLVDSLASELHRASNISESVTTRFGLHNYYGSEENFRATPRPPVRGE